MQSQPAGFGFFQVRLLRPLVAIPVLIACGLALASALAVGPFQPDLLRIPAYPDAYDTRVDVAEKVKSGNTTLYVPARPYITMTFTTADSPVQVRDYYRKQLESDRWTCFICKPDRPDLFVLFRTYGLDGTYYQFEIETRPLEATTSVTITRSYTPKY